MMQPPNPSPPSSLRAAQRAYLFVKRPCCRVLGAGLALARGPLTGRRRTLARRASRLLLAGRRTLVGPSRRIELRGGGVMAPGMIHEIMLWKWMNLEVHAEELDGEYLRRLSPVRDVSILLRWLWLSLVARESSSKRETVFFNLFGVIVNNADVKEVLNSIMLAAEARSERLGEAPAGQSREDLAGQSREDLAGQSMKALAGRSGPAPAHICFVNANNFNIAVEKPEFLQALKAADLVLPDGIGVKLALRMAGGRLRRNLNGTDLFPPLIEEMIRRDWGIFLLGAEPQVLAKARANMQKRFPALKIAGVHDGFFKPEDEPALNDEINRSGARAVVIGMGTPRQEYWAVRNLPLLRVPLVLSMGGLLDFWGEKNRRAPAWMRQCGIEWVYRMMQEPRRMWRRYIIGNPVFLWRVSRWKRSQRPSPPPSP